MGALVRSERGAARDKEERNAQGRQYLSFLVGAETFSIEISSIKEIIEYRAPTDVPMMPPFMRGIINLRGRVVPVIDLSVRFGRAPIVAARRTCIVIVEIESDGEHHDIGVAVDAVSAVLEIADEAIEAPPSFGAKLRADFISGMGKVGEKFIIILEIQKVLSVEELAALANAASDPSQVASAAPDGPQAQPPDVA